MERSVLGLALVFVAGVAYGWHFRAMALMLRGGRLQVAADRARQVAKSQKLSSFDHGFLLGVEIVAVAMSIGNDDTKQVHDTLATWFTDDELAMRRREARRYPD